MAFNRDWTGNKNSIYKTLGASSHTNKEREENDYYATEPKAVELLLELEDFTNFHVWESACGQGHLSEAMIQKGIKVNSSDLILRGYDKAYEYDFLSEENKEWKGHIITNPPYKHAQAFIEKALSIVPNGCKVAMFLKVQFLEGKARKELFEIYPPKTVYVSSSRLLCAKNGEFEQMKKAGGSAVAYAWFVWEEQDTYPKDYATQLKWFN
jgi:hypothetical protein